MNTRDNYNTAKRNNFTCLLCRKKVPDIEFELKKSGLFCSFCNEILNILVYFIYFVVLPLVVLGVISASV